MLKKSVLVLLVLLLLPVASRSQLKSQIKRSTNISQALRSGSSLNHGFIFGFLDPSRFHIFHSYSMCIFSFGGKTFSQGLYLSTMSYRISDPLLLKVRLGLLHQPFGGWRSMGVKWRPRSGLFLSDVELNYRPSKNIFMQFYYGTSPGLGNHRLTDPY